MTEADFLPAIQQSLESYSIAQWVGAITNNREHIRSFEAAAMAYWAMMLAPIDLDLEAPPSITITAAEFAALRRSATRYFLADPGNSTLFSLVRRQGSGQLKYELDPSGAFARAYCLFVLLAPRALPNGKFDFEVEFRRHYGASPLEWLQVAAVAWASTVKVQLQPRAYFDLAREQGMVLPADATVCRILETLSTCPDRFRESAAGGKQADRTYFAYDRNPLLMHPIVRPWGIEQAEPHLDYFAIPVPGALSYRITARVREDMLRACGEAFTTFFGDVFSEYVGELLDSGSKGAMLFSERDLKSLLGKDIKRPDWVLVTPGSSFSFECKAARLDASVEATGRIHNESTVARHLVKAGSQFVEFDNACERRLAPDDPLRSVAKRWHVIVTWEELFIGKSELRQMLGVAPDDPTLILSIGRVEVLLGVIALGEAPDRLFEDIENLGFDTAVGEAIDRTGFIHGDSYLSKYTELLFASIDPGIGQPEADRW